MDEKLNTSVYTYIFLIVVISIVWMICIPNLIAIGIVFISAVVSISAVLINAKMTKDRLEIKPSDRKL